MANIKALGEIFTEKHSHGKEWNLRAVVSEDCVGYVAWNENTCEGILVDPKAEEIQTCLAITRELKNFLWIAVIDTHTHADHISCAADLAEKLNAPLVMHSLSITPRAQVRISRSSSLSSHAGPLQFILTPGHTPDGLCVQWGPFLFTGDTVLYNDVGRDDLPGGDAVAHFQSLEILKTLVKPDTIVLPGHDAKGGRASLWKTQLLNNSSLTQSKDEYVAEARAFDAPPPKLFKKSLFENFK